MRRMAVLYRLLAGRTPRVLVASAAGLFRKVIARGGVRSAVLPGDRRAAGRARGADPAGWSAAGYGRVQVVEDPGTFAVRGAVLDLFPPVYRHPLRLELFGDELESLRLFDAASQRTLRTVERAHIHPVRETILTEGADPRARILAAADAASLPSSKTRHLLEQIEAGEDFFGIESLAPAFHRQMAPAFEYLPARHAVRGRGSRGGAGGDAAGLQHPARERRAPAGRAPAGAGRRRTSSWTRRPRRRRWPGARRIELRPLEIAGSEATATAR